MDNDSVNRENGEVLDEEAKSEEITEVKEAEETAAENIEEPVEEAADEAGETAEEPTEETADEAEETSEETGSEDNPEETDEEKGPAYGDVICPNCGKMPVANGHEYCYKCETELTKTPIPVAGWIFGAIALVFSLVAFVMCCLLSPEALQVVKGDMYFEKKNWFSAYENYDDVNEVRNDVSGIMSDTVIVNIYNNVLKKFGSSATFDNLIATGAKLRLKQFIAVEHVYDPVQANQYMSQIFSGPNDRDFISKNSYVKKNQAIYDEYYNTYTALTEIITPLYEAEKPSEEMGRDIIAQMEELKGQKGISDVWVSYLAYSVAGYCGFKDEEMATMFEEVDKAAKESKKDYSWLYYDEYISRLIAADRDEEAIPYIETLMEKDMSDYDPYIAMERIFIKKGDYDTAGKYVEKYCENNHTTDGAHSDSNYNLMINLERCKGNYDYAMQLIDEANGIYTLIPEFDRQLALIYLTQGDYLNAFLAAYSAEDKASCRYYYYNDTTAYTQELGDTVFVCTYLCANNVKDIDADTQTKINELLESFDGNEFDGKAAQIVKGEVSVAQVLTEGVCDIL